MRYLPPDFPGYGLRPGQEIVGDDFDCLGSLVTGTCTLPTATAAALVCSHNPTCASIVWYPNGTDGCSAKVAVVKRSHPSAANTRMAPRAAVLDALESVPLVRAWLGRGCPACGLSACGLGVACGTQPGMQLAARLAPDRINRIPSTALSPRPAARAVRPAAAGCRHTPAGGRAGGGSG